MRPGARIHQSPSTHLPSTSLVAGGCRSPETGGRAAGGPCVWRGSRVAGPARGRGNSCWDIQASGPCWVTGVGGDRRLLRAARLPRGHLGLCWFTLQWWGVGPHWHECGLTSPWAGGNGGPPPRGLPTPTGRVPPWPARGVSGLWGGRWSGHGGPGRVGHWPPVRGGPQHLLPPQQPLQGPRKARPVSIPAPSATQAGSPHTSPASRSSQHPALPAVCQARCSPGKGGSVGRPPPEVGGRTGPPWEAERPRAGHQGL